MRPRPPLALLAVSLVSLCLACGGDDAPVTPTSPVASGPPTVANPDALKDAGAVIGRWVGTAVQTGMLADPLYATTFTKHFNYVTAEWEMKWDPIQKQRGVFEFSRGDQIVAFAQARGMRVKGHTLLWHNATPSWVTALSADELRQVTEEHIRTVVGHYKGSVVAWDVVNEAVDDNGRDLRNNVFLQKLGAGYIADAFRIAHEADPSALLIYNDYSGEGRNAKSDRIYELVKSLVEQGVPIGGVGLQMHVDATSYPAAADILSNMQRLADLGLAVNISEMDVRIRNVSADKWTKQKQVYKEITGACMAVPRCHAISFWGFTDRYSWVDSAFGADDPLLFDESYQAKPAFFGVQEALLGR